MKKERRLFPRLRTIFASYHNGLSYFEIVSKLSKPHGITSLGEGKYLVSLWASSNFYLIDLKARKIESANFNGGNGNRFALCAALERSSHPLCLLFFRTMHERHQHID